MCDSVTYYFPLKEMPQEDYVKASFPFDILQSTDNHGELKPSFFRWMTATSPVTEEKFKIKGVPVSGSGFRPKLAGYLVEINLPACTVGNNLLLENSVFTGSRAALQLLKYWLLERGCTRVGIKAVSLTTAIINSVTLTYLVPCEDKSDAHALRREMFLHGAALHNKKYREKPVSKTPVYQVGTDAQATVYMKHHDYKISGYVKDDKVSGASSHFPSAEVEDAVRIEARGYLRVEITLGKTWLNNNDRQSVASWRLTKGESPYAIGIQLIRDYLRLDDNLRTRRPKPEHMESLSEEDQELLHRHLAGKNVKKHASLAGKNSFKFYPLRKRILDQARIDISIPWEVQNAELSARLNSMLAITKQYRPPEELADHVFCRPTVERAIGKLKELLNEKMRA